MARVMSKAGQELLDQVRSIKNGVPAKTWSPEQLLVIQTRKDLQKTQETFAQLLDVPISTVRDWEQGRRKPDSAAITLIRVARKHPQAVLDVTI